MYNQAILALLIVCQIGQSWSLNPVARSIQQYPRAYNLHQEFTPQTINDLSVDMKKRAMLDVKQTISEVERLLQQDPALPRLTKGEIQDIFENVTRDELVKSIQMGDKSREKHMRALMLVLPYHANDLSPENLEELYTRAPITKLMNNNEPRRNVVHLPIPPSPLSQRERLATTYRPSHKYRNVMTTKYIRKVNPTTFHPKPNFVTTRNYPMPTTFTPSDNYRREKIKERFSSQYNADKLQYLPNLRRGPVRENMKDVLSAMGLATEDPINFNLDSEPTSTPISLMPWETGVNFVTAPPPPPKPLPSTNDIQDILKTLGLLQPPPKLQYQIRPSKLAAPLSLNHHDSQPRGVSTQFLELPQIVDLLDAAENVDKPVAAPLVQEKPETPKFESFKPLPLKTKEVKMSIAPKISPRDFVSFKKLPEETPKVINEEFADFLKMYGLIGSPHRESKAVEATSTATTSTTTISTTETLQTSTGSTIEQSVVTESQYLPEEYEEPHTTEHQVQSTATPSKLEMPMKGIPEISRELLSPSMFGVLDNMGFAPEKPQKLKRTHDSSIEETPRPSPVYQAPKPNQDFTKLQKLFVTIHELDKQNRNLTVADLEALNIEGFGDLLQPGPDPLSYNEYDVAKNEVKRQSEAVTTGTTPTRINLELEGPISQTVEEEIVEEKIVTRQQTPPVVVVTPTSEALEATTSGTTTMTTTTTTTTTARPTSTTASNTARANNLADSFPKETGPVVEETLPPPRRNGFYFYSDWNTFLQVGEDENKVLIQFDPKIGDPSRFVEVNIPSKTT